MATIIDLAIRMLIGWQLPEHMRSSLAYRIPSQAWNGHEDFVAQASTRVT